MDAYVIDIFDIAGNAEARVGKTIIARTNSARLMRETVVGNAVYFPKSDIRTEFLVPSTTKTFCPFKGTTSYWSIVLPNGTVIEDAGWSYDRPLIEAKEVDNHIAFDENKVSVAAKTGEFITDADDDHDDDFTNWLLNQAWIAPSPEDFVKALSEQFVALGIPVKRMNVALWSLHPEMVGRNYTWWRGIDEISVFDLPMGVMQREEFLNSPTLYVSEGRGGVRQRLDDPNPEFEFSIMKDLREKGCTDYVAMPLVFSDGISHVLSLASDTSAGFSTADLGRIFLHSGVIARIFEVHVQRQTTASLLQTYLGARSAKLVLSGEFHRGDGDSIEAAILYCDLRGSTQMAEQMSRPDLLKSLNGFFDIVVGEVEAQGGEVLKFIGDAVLAIFPNDDDAAQVSTKAVTAAQGILENISQSKSASGEPMSCVVALHYGEVTYGNVGAQARLDYTVAGKAVNEVVRLQELCKVEGRDCLMSDTITEQLDIEGEPLGEHRLRGTGRLRTIYALAS